MISLTLITIIQKKVCLYNKFHMNIKRQRIICEDKTLPKV